MERVAVDDQCFLDAHSKIELLVSSIPKDPFVAKLDKDLHAWPGLSGIDGSNYCAVFDKKTHKNAISLISQINHLDLPIEITDHMNSLSASNYYSKSGFFDGYAKCWIIIENILYIWTINDARNLIKFDFLNEIIMDVCLVDTPGELFTIEDSNILIVSTPNEVLCLPVNMTATNSTSLDYHVTIKRQVLCTADYSGIEKLILYRNNRIFALNIDGEIFEIYFEINDGILLGIKLKNKTATLFSKILPTFTNIIFGTDERRVKYMFVDEHRYLLYSITNWNVIKTYELGENKPEFKHISTITYQEVFQSVKKLYNKFTVDDLGEFTSHSIILPKFSQELSLKIYTSTAMRLYFKYDQKSHIVSLHHVRFPPIYQSLESFEMKSAVDINDISICFMNSTLDQNSKDNYKISKLFATTHSVFNPQSSFNEIHELKPDNISFNCQKFWTTLALGDKQTVILNDYGLLFISVKDNKEIFSDFMAKYDFNSDEMISFVVMSSPVYSCMIAIDLMINSNANTQNLLHFFNLNAKNPSTQALKYQELPSSIPGSFDMTISFGTNMHSILNNTMNNHTQMKTKFNNDDVFVKNSYSTILKAIYTYTASLLVKIWKDPIFIEQNVSLNIGKNLLLVFLHEKEYMEELILKLTKLKHFLRDYAKIIFGNASNELQSCVNIIILIEIVIEFLSLFDIISVNKYPIHVFIPKKYWPQLTKCEFQEFIQKYDTHSALIIENLLTYYLDNAANVEELNLILSQKCPQIYTEVDALFSKATQYLNLSQSSKNDRNKFIEKALEIYISIMPSLNIRHACFNLLKCKAFDEIAMLCIYKIKRSTNTELDKEILEIICETLKFLYFISKNGKINESLASNFINYTQSSAEKDFKNMIKTCISADVSSIHMKVLKTLVELKEFKFILNINSPYLSSFIQKIVDSSDMDLEIDSNDCLEIAWRYFELKSEFFLAAKYLFQKVTQDINMKLREKSEVINKVILLLKCIKYSDCTSEVTNFRSVVNNCKIAMNVQINVLQRLLQIHAPQSTLDSLHSMLFSLEDILIRFVHPYDLHDCKLDIIANSDTEIPPQLIFSVWSQFIRQQVEKYALCGSSMALFSDTLVKYKDTQKIFPFVFIIKCALKECENYQVSPKDLMITIITKSSIDVNKVIEALHHILGTNEVRFDLIGESLLILYHQYQSNIKHLLFNDCIEYLKKNVASNKNGMLSEDNKDSMNELFALSLND